MRWTQEEKDYLKNNYNKFGIDFCVEKLQKSISSIITIANRMGLKTKLKEDISGQKFGKLKVLSYSCSKKYKSGKARFWNCECECGRLVEVRTNHLKSKGSKTCGYCEVITKYIGGKYITGTEFKNIETNAKSRSLEFNITIEDIERVYEKQCFKCALSGVDIFFNSRQINNSTILGNASVDRKDSYKGYTIDNIQILDKYVNIAKQRLSDKEFIEMCRRVSKYNE